MRQCFGRAIPGTSEALWEDRGPRIMTTMDQPLSEVGDPSAEKALGRWMHLTPEQDAARRRYNADAAVYEEQLTAMQLGGESDSEDPRDDHENPPYHDSRAFTLEEQ